ncbi:carboxypeptidase M32 [Cochlodiniinecator piscidefendens]|uniref:carboxypeptidase M32 n=1 Tax=Cochlodiniinecator piscidefendens TaxID=2715756 RepID=UPI001408131C|nr:carboxypeptidase M32 [Cochlodiniinecator piscidefendens]
MQAYSELMAFQRETEALGQIAGRLGWDQETMMARGSSNQRAEEGAAMEGVLHARRTDPKIAQWLEQTDESALSVVERANLRLIRRKYERTAKVPARLAAELARATSLGQGIWAEARANEDFVAFAPALKDLIKLRQEEADALADGGDRYDALLQEYEPGVTAAELSSMFGALRPRLVALREKILGASHQPEKLSGTFTADKQMKIAHTLAANFGFNFDMGRLDKAVHPFSNGSGQDVRITTRTVESDPFNCFYSTIHEAGHACYELGVDAAYHLTPLGCGVSMGVHESQSRIYENQIGRSEAFTSYLFDLMRQEFGDLSVADAEAFYGSVNRVGEGYIRTEADELQYNLHVLLRFDLEQKLLSGELAVEDLPTAWNERFERDFGFAVDKPSNGCLQDVHWSVGYFGYFPTYSLGNVYAGCLNQAMRQALPDLDASLVKGDTSPATGWLRENLQQHGGLYEPRDVIEKACGFAPTEAPLLNYLEEKFSAIYKL